MKTLNVLAIAFSMVTVSMSAFATNNGLMGEKSLGATPLTSTLNVFSVSHVSNHFYVLASDSKKIDNAAATVSHVFLKESQAALPTASHVRHNRKTALCPSGSYPRPNSNLALCPSGSYPRPNNNLALCPSGSYPRPNSNLA